MIVIGLLLMAACAAAAVDAVWQNTHAIHIVVFGQSVSDLSAGALLVAGAVIGLLFALGLTLMAGGFGRARRRRQARRAAVGGDQRPRVAGDRLGPEIRRPGSDMSVYPSELSADEVR